VLRAAGPNIHLTIPVLTYHGINVIQNTYAQNDHLALASDLLTIHNLGFEVIPLRQVVNWHQGLIPDTDALRKVAISFDDGSWFDYYDLDHPTCGPQRSMINILKDHNDKCRPSSPAHATSFVISSPQARSSLDKSCMIGKDWWGDQWWLEASASGLMDVECHSWDHVHPELDQVAQQNQIKGDFSQVRCFADAEVQFVRAGEYIGKVMNGKRPSLFAYPYGTVSDYVVNEFLPEYQSRHRFKAAFTTEPRPVSKADNIWQLPRFVFGHDWRSPEGLMDLLYASQNGPMA
jgi:peptidoglycan/xylan/chitin deacetylase (PgdA/CDA1 family)